MTPEELRAVISGLVDNAGSHRLSGEIAYANGLMDAAQRLGCYLPEQETAARAPKPDVDVVVVPAAKAEPEPIDAVDDLSPVPLKRKRIKRPKGA